MIKMQRVNKDDCKSNFRLFEKDGTIESRELQVCIGEDTQIDIKDFCTCPKQGNGIRAKRFTFSFKDKDAKFSSSMKTKILKPNPSKH